MRYLLTLSGLVLLLTSCTGGQNPTVIEGKKDNTHTPVPVTTRSRDILQDARDADVSNISTGSKVVIAPIGQSGDTVTITTNGPTPIPMSPEEEIAAKKRRDKLLNP